MVVWDEVGGWGGVLEWVGGWVVEWLNNPGSVLSPAGTSPAQHVTSHRQIRDPNRRSLGGRDGGREEE